MVAEDACASADPAVHDASLASMRLIAQTGSVAEPCAGRPRTEQGYVMDFKGFPGLAGKTAIVTGSTQGLGADIARGLAAAGANVVLVGRNAPAGQALADELRERALYCETDIGQDAQIERCIQAALASFGRIDILVNNACQYADQGLASSREQWHATLDTNLVSAAIFTQLVAPRLRAAAWW